MVRAAGGPARARPWLQRAGPLPLLPRDMRLLVPVLAARPGAGATTVAAALAAALAASTAVLAVDATGAEPSPWPVGAGPGGGERPSVLPFAVRAGRAGLDDVAVRLPAGGWFAAVVDAGSAGDFGECARWAVRPDTVPVVVADPTEAGLRAATGLVDRLHAGGLPTRRVVVAVDRSSRRLPRGVRAAIGALAGRGVPVARLRAGRWLRRAGPGPHVVLAARRLGAAGLADAVARAADPRRADPADGSAAPLLARLRPATPDRAPPGPEPRVGGWVPSRRNARAGGAAPILPVHPADPADPVGPVPS